MDGFWQITDELAVAGQVTFDDLQRLVEQGYQSVVNLRLPNEIGLLNNEQQKAEYLGLCYINIPVQIKNLTLDDVHTVIQQLDILPKPMVVHCDSGIRSSIIVLLQIAIGQGMKAEDALQRVAKLGLFDS
jgi:uncharacterized protein (TIGR01244 family)